jgi:hypothetical protein
MCQVGHSYLTGGHFLTGRGSSFRASAFMWAGVPPSTPSGDHDLELAFLPIIPVGMPTLIRAPWPIRGDAYGISDVRLQRILARPLGHQQLCASAPLRSLCSVSSRTDSTFASPGLTVSSWSPSRQTWDGRAGSTGISTHAALPPG